MIKGKAFLFCILLVLLISCIKDQQEVINRPYTAPVFNATMETPNTPGTRVFADNKLRVLWNADDRVSIFNKSTYNRQYQFTGKDGDNSGSFTMVSNDGFVTGNPLNYVYAVYPYNEDNRITNDGEITINLPAVQSYRENSFGLGSNTMIAITEEDELMFKNLCGYLAISLYGDNVTVSSVSLKGNNNEPLGGKASVSSQLHSAPTFQFSPDESTKELTVLFETPIQIGKTEETATTFWFAVPPTSFSDGFTLTVKDNNNGVFEKMRTRSFDVERNTLHKMTALKVEIISQDNYQPLTLEAIEDGEILFSNPLGLTIQYSIDGANWVSESATSIHINIKAGERVQFRGDNETYSLDVMTSSEKKSTIECSAPCYVYGNIMSLIHSDGYSSCDEIKGSGAFYGLFSGNQNIFNHPEHALMLPANTLSEYCYAGMFHNCTGLTVAPGLPALKLASSCYSNMFNGCSSLKDTPELPATTLANYCYYKMFAGCTSIETCTSLPASTLAYGCYWSMFDGCTSLKIAPDLPATVLAESCYQSMFSSCTALETAPTILPAMTMKRYCYKGMFRNCSVLQTAPILPAEILEKYCYQELFYNCTSLNFIKAMFLGPGAAIGQWVYNVAPTGTFIMNENATWGDSNNIIPSGWQVYTDGSDSGINVYTYMTHTKGKKAVPLVIIPDGFVETDLPKFRARAIEGIETMFSVEPYKTYRDYFSVYIIEIPSEESGASITDGQGNITTRVNNYFETRWGASSYNDMRANEVKVKQIASLCPDIISGDSQIWNVPVALLVNDTRYGGICIIDGHLQGVSYCIIPYSHSGESINWSYPESEAANLFDDSQGSRRVTTSEFNEMGVCYGNWSNIFVHEYGGHAFGRLEDEYWYGSTSAPTTYVAGHLLSTPFGLNISGKYNQVAWQELIDKQQQLISIDDHYSRIGIYQGGEKYMFGRWRSEKISCMIDNRLYFSAWQRYLIAQRIMKIAGELDSFSFDSWLETDKTDDPIRDKKVSQKGRSTPTKVHFEEPLLPPVVLDR